MELRMVKLSDFLTPINYCHPNNCGQARRHVQCMAKSELSPFSTGTCPDFACDQLRVLRASDLAQSGVWLCGAPL
jgi:hypothetical protein